MFPNSPNQRISLLNISFSKDEIGNRTKIITSQKDLTVIEFSVSSQIYKESMSEDTKITRAVKFLSLLYSGQKYVLINEELYKIERTYQSCAFIELYLSKQDE